MSHRYFLKFVVPSFFAAAVVLVSGAHGALVPAFLSMLLLLLLCVMAIPVSRVLFGNGIAAHIFSVPVGYLFHSFLLAVCAKLFGINPLGFIIYFLAAASVAAVTSWKTRHFPESEITSDWGTSDKRLLALWLLVALAMVTLPFLHVGATTPKGFAFRAYFNTDVFRNMATAGSLVFTGVPPENPYFSGYPLHYYWLFHVLPAYWITILPSLPVEAIFVQFALVTGLTFVAVLFVTVRRFTSSKFTMLLTLPLFAFGGSYEGLFVLYYLWRHHASWKAFTRLNIDGILRWFYGMPQIDTLFRPLLYAPQHLMIVMILLISILFWSFMTKRKTSSVLALLLLAFISVGFSVIIGALLVLGTGVILLNELRMNPRAGWISILAGGTIGLTFLYLYLNPFAMFSIHHGDLKLCFNWSIRQHPLGFLILNWGALLLLGLAGLFTNLKRNWILLLFFGLSLFFIFLVQLTSPGLSDVSLKAGYITDAVLLTLSAIFVDNLLSQKRTAAAVLLVAVLALPGLATTLMDEYNSQDIQNPKFTTYISRDKMEVLRWIRRNMEPRVRLQDFGSAKTSFITSFVSELPPFANRSVFLGDVILSQIFQTPKEELEERRKILLYIVESETPRMISDLAQKAKIEYILDSSGPGSPFRMPEASSFFKMAYSEGNVALYKVNTVAIENEMRNSVILLERNGERLLSSRYAKNFYPPEPVEVNLFSRWISNEGEIQVESSTETQGVLVFIVQSMGKNRTMQISLDDHVIFEQTISLSSMKVRVPVKFEPGQHTLRIHSVEGAERANVYFGGSDKRILSFRMWFLHFRPEK